MVLSSACSRQEEVEQSEVEGLRSVTENTILENTIYKPGPSEYSVGKKGGNLVFPVFDDPKTFNIINVRDAGTSNIISFSFDTLADYDPYKREFIPRLATFTIDRDMENRLTFVTYTLRDDIYWRTASGDKVKVTSDDLVFWYNDIQGNPNYQMGYDTQFIETKSGDSKQITIEKLSDREVRFTVPEIIANPVYYTNMSFGPRYKYEEFLAKDTSPDKDYENLFALDMDPKEFPSLTGYVLSEYKPGQYIEYKNIEDKDFWQKDTDGATLPYISSITFKIVKTDTTQVLLFKQGELAAVGVQIAQLSNMLDSIKALKPPDGIVYNKGPSLDSSFISFNQNPNSGRYEQRWFIQKEFRQAMSMLLPREKIIEQVYSGLGEPAIYFFSKQNKFFDKNISLEYTYNPEKAKQLLEKIGFEYKDDGLLYDDNGMHVEFDFNFGTGVQQSETIAGLFQEELEKIGITMRVIPLDFQFLVENITKTFQWDAIMVGVSGATYFPESAPSVWLSKGATHVWNPSQKVPATQWERRVDELYYQGLYTLDDVERKKIYDEYQKIILEQVPLLYIAYSYSFTATKNSIQNVFLDNLKGSVLSDSEYLYLE